MLIIDSHPASTMARYFAWCYSALIVITSLYPFTGWRTTGVPIVDFYTYPLPYHQNAFDNLLNVIAYIPLGFAVAMWHGKRWLGFIVALCWGGSLSAAVEFIQQFLTTRVASNLDIMSNTLGVGLGALLATVIPWRPLQHYLRVRRSQWADMGVVWLVLWPVSQLNPVQPLFSPVNTLPDLPQVIHSSLNSPALSLTVLAISNVLFHIISVAVYASCLVLSRRAIARIVWLTFALGFSAKIAAALYMIKPVQFFIWLNVDVLVGGFAAIGVIPLLLNLPAQTRAIIGTGILLFSLLISWSWALIPSWHATARLLNTGYGHVPQLSALANMITALWPYGALAILVGIAIRHR